MVVMGMLMVWSGHELSIGQNKQFQLVFINTSLNTFSHNEMLSTNASDFSMHSIGIRRTYHTKSANTSIQFNSIEFSLKSRLYSEVTKWKNKKRIIHFEQECSGNVLLEINFPPQQLSKHKSHWKTVSKITKSIFGKHLKMVSNNPLQTDAVDCNSD